MHFRKLIDLTHVLHPDIPQWENSCGFENHLLLDYDQCTTKTKFRVLEYRIRGGSGTHMDAPTHCIPDGKDISLLPVEDFLVPCSVIDLSPFASADYLLSVGDVRDYETRCGKIVKGVFVAIHTGWSKRWPDRTAYRNEDQSGKMHFPGVSSQAAEYLLEREVVGLGIDTLSPEGTNEDYPVHQIFLGSSKYIVENLANLNQMPSSGASILVLPLKIQGATESPIRAVGLIP